MCSTPAGGDACGQCRNCTLITAGTHPDLIEETFEINEKTKELRKEILITQVRRLGEKLVLTPQIAAGQVALVYPAEAMNRNAFNALLKTLEEPPAGRTLILIADRPQRLPATIRSRCQWLRLEIPPVAEALAWLQAQGHAPVVAQQALEAAQGNPGLAEQYLAEDGWAAPVRGQGSGGLGAATCRRGGTGSRLDRRPPGAALRFCGELVRDHLAHRAERCDGCVWPQPAFRATVGGSAGTLVRCLRPHAAVWTARCARTLQLAELLIGWQRLAS